MVLCVALGAMAQAETEAVVKMTYVDYNNSTTAMGEIAAGETARTGYNKISGGSVALANSGWGVNYITYIQVDASSVTDDIIGATLSIEVSGTTDNKRTTCLGVGYNNSIWSADMTYATADKTITTLGSTQWTSTKSSTTFEKKTFDILAAFENDANADKIVTLLVYGITNAGGSYIKNPQVTITSADASAMTTYTVKYVDESGDEITNASVYDILIGASASIADENKVAIYAKDKKYIYKSCDKESITTDEDATLNVITATFREAATWNYTVNAVIEGGDNVLKQLAVGTNFEEETIKVPYNQYIIKGGVIYEAPKNSSEYNASIVLEENNMVKTVEYSIPSLENVVYFIEAEDIKGMTGTTSANANVRCSNATGAYNGSETPVEVLTLTPGTYTIKAQVWGNKGQNLTINCGDESLVVPTVGYLTSGTLEFTLAENTLVTIPKCGDSGKCLDWILIQSAEANSLLVAEEGKDLDVEGNYASATYTRAIEAGKYGTICLPFAPDAASLENYTFFTMTSAEDGALNFVVDEAPVANKPYIYSLNEDKEATAITGEATEVSATTTDVEVNGWTMKGSFTNQAIDATTGNFYGLSSGTIVKANKTLTVKPYRAYFTSATGESAVALRITRGDETTEITTADLDVQPATVIYDLAGRRVEKMEKGIYIVNGKKVIR